MRVEWDEGGGEEGEGAAPTAGKVAKARAAVAAAEPPRRRALVVRVAVRLKPKRPCSQARKRAPAREW